MTIGAINSPPADPFNYVTRSWNGVDGKYEIVNGRRRVKFNNYDMTSAMLSTTCPSRHADDNNYRPGWILPPSGFGLNDDVKVQANLTSKVRGSSLHLGKNIGEGRQFLSMVNNTLSTIGRTALALKRGEPQLAASILIDAHKLGKSYRNYEVIQLLKKFRPTAHGAAGRWLELQYGWKPLISDVYEAKKKFESDMTGVSKSSEHASATRTIHYDASISPSLYNITGFANFVTKIRIEYTEEDTITMSRALGLEDPVGIAWEIIPFSFVADWFMPIGSYLESLNILPTLKGRWVRTRVLSAHGSWAGARNPQYEGASLSGTYISVERRHGEGFSFTDISPPDLRPLGDAFSPTHIYNAVALTTQAISGLGFSRK